MDKGRADTRVGPNGFLMEERAFVCAGVRGGLETSTSGDAGVGNELVQLFRIGGWEFAGETLAEKSSRVTIERFTVGK